MRTDLKINYADLEILSGQISSYYDALESIETALGNLKKVLEEQKSEAVDELLENISDASYDADDKKNTLRRLKEILDDYLADMRSLLKPIRENEIVRADQCDIWYNVKQIEGPIKDIKENAAVECSGNYHTIPAVEDVGEKAKREKEERNYRKLEDFRKYNLVLFADRVNKKLKKIRDIYKNNVKPFEETDDAYRKKLNKLYSECTDTKDKILDGLSFVGSVSFTFLTTLGGILVGAWILAQLPAALAIGLIVAPIVGCIIMAAVPEEYVPDWLKDVKHKDDEIIKTIKAGPVAILEAIGQGLADTVQTPEGIAAVSATVVGLVLVFKGSKKKKTDLDSESGGVEKVALEGESSGTRLAQYGDNFGKMGTYVENPNIKVNWSQYAEHGLERMQQRGMTQEMIDQIVAKGKVLSQNNGSKFAFITRDGVAIVSKDGKLITAWSSKYYDSAMQEIIIKLFGE